MEPFFASKFKFKLLHKLELELELELFATPTRSAFRMITRFGEAVTAVHGALQPATEACAVQGCR
jgi:hypothetical protein